MQVISVPDPEETFEVASVELQLQLIVATRAHLGIGGAVR